MKEGIACKGRDGEGRCGRRNFLWEDGWRVRLGDGGIVCGRSRDAEGGRSFGGIVYDRSSWMKGMKWRN